jgi:hypothetical protein
MARLTARARPATSPWLAWAWGAAMTAAVLILLWATVQPGIALQWSVSDGGLTGFRVYRAPAGSANFGLLRQVPARPDARQYTYVDTLLVPGQTYVYRVEAVGQSGPLAASPTITGNALTALPYQLAILLTSLIAGYVAVMLARQWQGSSKSPLRLPA